MVFARVLMSELWTAEWGLARVWTWVVLWESALVELGLG
jgi:hypothetical protein